MNKLFEDFRSFCLHNDIEVEDINGFTYKFSHETIEGKETDFYLRVEGNTLNLIINLDKSARRALKGLAINETGRKLNFVKPKSFVWHIESRTVDSILNEISNVVFLITERLTEAGREKPFEAGEKTCKKLYSDDDVLYLDEQAYRMIFGEPDLWLTNFLVQVQRNYASNLMNVSIFIDNAEHSSLILYNSLPNLSCDTTIQEILQTSHLYFNHEFKLTKRFFECFLPDNAKYMDFSMKKIQNRSDPANFVIKSSQGTEVIEYDRSASPSIFLNNLIKKIQLSFNSLDISEFND